MVSAIPLFYYFTIYQFHYFSTSLFKFMDRAILLFGVIGALMFTAYVYFIIKTSYYDEKLKKKEKLEQERLEEENKIKLNSKH